MDYATAKQMEEEELLQEFGISFQEKISRIVAENYERLRGFPIPTMTAADLAEFYNSRRLVGKKRRC